MITVMIMILSGQSNLT